MESLNSHHITTLPLPHHLQPPPHSAAKVELKRHAFTEGRMAGSFTSTAVDVVTTATAKVADTHRRKCSRDCDHRTYYLHLHCQPLQFRFKNMYCKLHQHGHLA